MLCRLMPYLEQYGYDANFLVFSANRGTFFGQTYCQIDFFVYLCTAKLLGKNWALVVRSVRLSVRTQDFHS